MMAGIPVVLWDLDGTLTNSALGITRGLQHVLRTLGHPVPEASELLRFIGPPMNVTLAGLIGSDAPDRLDPAIALYRARYNEVGKFENEVIPGVEAALTQTKASGARMFVATSKLETYSVDIVAHFGLAGFFDRVYGSQLDGSRAEKAELIAYILETEKLDPGQTVMIGDRMHDIVGARKNGRFHRRVVGLWRPWRAGAGGRGGDC